MDVGEDHNKKMYHINLVYITNFQVWNYYENIY